MKVSIRQRLAQVVAWLCIVIAVGSSVGAFWYGTQVKVLRTELNAVQSDLAALQGAVKAAKEVQERDIKARAIRQEQARAVRKVKQEVLHEVQSGTVFSAAELDGLRRVVEAGNASVRAAGAQ